MSPPSSTDEPSFAFHITTGAAAPIYRQLVEQVTISVAAGLLASGAKMPSVRAVAESLLINPNTVARAYSDLMQAGVLQTQPGRGVFVAAASSHQRYSDPERADRLARAAAQFVHAVALLGYRNSELLQAVQQALGALGEDHSFTDSSAESIHSETEETTHA